MVEIKLKKPEPEFSYTDDVGEITPFKLNLSITESQDLIITEVRKRARITESNKQFWKEFFTASLTDTPIIIHAQITFRDKIASIGKLKRLGLVDESVKVKIIKD